MKNVLSGPLYSLSIKNLLACSLLPFRSLSIMDSVLTADSQSIKYLSYLPKGWAFCLGKQRWVTDSGDDDTLSFCFIFSHLMYIFFY